LSEIKTIAVLGGTGKEGSGLALRWASAGLRVLIGSRDAAKAQATAQTLKARLGTDNIVGLLNREAAAQADVVVLTLPYAGQQPIVQEIRDVVQGKVVVNVSVPLDPASPRKIQVPPAGSASAEVQEILGTGAKVVAAFQNVSHGHLQNLDEPVDCDILVCGDEQEAKAVAMNLVRRAGFEAFDAGALANAVAVEGLTAILININIQYKAKGAGIRVTGVKRAP